MAYSIEFDGELALGVGLQSNLLLPEGIGVTKVQSEVRVKEFVLTFGLLPHHRVLRN